MFLSSGEGFDPPPSSTRSLILHIKIISKNPVNI